MLGVENCIIQMFGYVQAQVYSAQYQPFVFRIATMKSVKEKVPWNDLYEEERNAKTTTKRSLLQEQKAKKIAELKSKLQKQLEDVMLRKANLFKEETELLEELQKTLRQITNRNKEALRQESLEEQRLRLKEIQNKKKQKKNQKQLKRWQQREKQGEAQCDADGQHWQY